jgi:hypothetical protein
VSDAKLAARLTPLQQDVLVGCMLGDAYIERAKSTHNARLRFDQTFPMHASYLMLLYGIFYDLTSKGPSLHIRKPDKRTGNVYSSLAFKTVTLPCLNIWHSLFYPLSRCLDFKIVPPNIGELLTARALAYFIMDDGGKGSYGEMNLHTRLFTLEDVQLLQQALADNFKLRTRLIEKTPGQWIIVIPVGQVESLRSIVLPYMHSSMLYKL